MGYLIDTNVLAEIRKGARGDTAVLKWFEDLPNSLGARILPVSREIADIWGRLGIPDPIPIADAIIAGTAIVHDLTLVTRDTKDMNRTGVRILNPFGA